MEEAGAHRWTSAIGRPGARSAQAAVAEDLDPHRPFHLFPLGSSIPALPRHSHRMKQRGKAGWARTGEARRGLRSGRDRMRFDPNTATTSTLDPTPSLYADPTNDTDPTQTPALACRPVRSPILVVLVEVLV